MQLTLNERLKIAKLHVKENVPITHLAKEYGVDSGRIKFYVALYNTWIKSVLR